VSRKMTKTTKPTKAATVSSAIQELLDMHTYCRPSGSVTEAEFCKRYLDTIPGAVIDAKGNRLVIVGADPSPKVLWSSHFDTVHRHDGYQGVVYGDGILTLSPLSSSTSSCLGADCTAGVWLMMQMIRSGVPGLYIFHTAEEIGGFGSSFIANKTPHLLDGIDYAIAFDRKGTNSVITHQGSRCASDGFATALGAYLSNKTYQLGPDDGGTFTDTANYTDLVPECTNVSVGYCHAHTSMERLDVRFLVHLRNKLCSPEFDVTMLPVLRDPREDELESFWRPGERDYDMVDMIADNPSAIADLLEDLGITYDEVSQYVYSKR
jgi:hypothetical protein